MRRIVAPVVVAVALAMSAFGCNGKEGNTKLPATGGCTLNSKLSLTVHVVRDADRMTEEIGRTPSAKPVVIPKCESWSVNPGNSLDMRALAGEIASKGIPGLSLRDADDEDLLHLKVLTG